jgi:hypothetical protein
MAGLAVRTVTNSHKRLLQRGWLSRGGKREALRGRRFRLRIPAGQKGIVLAQLPYRVRQRSVVHSRSLSADLWSNRSGLGKAAFCVWSRLDTESPISAETLSEAIGYRSAHTLRVHLRRLKQHGLARKAVDGWFRIDADLNALAQSMGIAGNAERRRNWHKEETKLHHEALAEDMRKAEREGRTVTDPTTGEMTKRIGRLIIKFDKPQKTEDQGDGYMAAGS